MRWGTWGKRRIAEGSGEVLVGSQKFLLGMLEMPIRYSSEDTWISRPLDSKPGAQGEVWESGFHMSVWES